MEPSRRWGDDRAILDDEEARRRILDAAGRCIVRRGNTQFQMGEVADEAGVSRSTVYRYFPGRDDVLLGLMLMRIDKALGDLVRSLPAPDDPVRSVPEMVLARVESVDGNPLNEALFAAESTAGLLDWQAVRRGHPARELAYTLITSLTPEDRRATQRDLLDDYRRALAAADGPDLDRDELWLRYRQGALYTYVAPLITAGMGGMQVEDIAMEGLRRGVEALDDLATIPALKISL